MTLRSGRQQRQFAWILSVLLLHSPLWTPAASTHASELRNSPVVRAVRTQRRVGGQHPWTQDDEVHRRRSRGRIQAGQWHGDRLRDR